MIVEVIPAGGVGRGTPLVLHAAQVMIRLDDGTPVGVAAHFGPQGGYGAALAGDKDFKRMLRALGVHETVLCERLVLPAPPPEARLIADPDAP